MRLLHTSDWHLGQTLRGEVDRSEEHRAFLAWLIDTAVAEAVQLVLIAGDIFDTSTPPASAEQQWFGFLAELRRRMPQVGVVVIAGNHDSPSRLGAAKELCRALNIYVVTAVPRDSDGVHTVEPLIIDCQGAQVIAMPFLRASDLPSAIAPEVATRELYRRAIELAAKKCRSDQVVIAMGHLYLAGASVSSSSERPIVIGGQEVIDSDLFGIDACGVAYAALGHLHRAQRVGVEHVRYAGSPIPMALDEASYRHQVVIVDVAVGSATTVKIVEVPRQVEIRRIPVRGAAPLEEVLVEIASLAAFDDAQPEWQRPWLEIQVALTKPEPRLKDQLDDALAKKSARLMKWRTTFDGDRQTLADAYGDKELTDLDPVEVFDRKWHSEHEQPPPDEIRRAFAMLVNDAHSDEPIAAPIKAARGKSTRK